MERCSRRAPSLSREKGSVPINDKYFSDSEMNDYLVFSNLVKTALLLGFPLGFPAGRTEVQRGPDYSQPGLGRFQPHERPAPRFSAAREGFSASEGLESREKEVTAETIRDMHCIMLYYVE